MDFSKQFDLIRPYRDHEVHPAIERLINHPMFKPVLNYLFEGEDEDQLLNTFRSIHSVDHFQKFFSKHTVGRIVEKTSTGLTVEGIERLDRSMPYLFVGNHRDIVLDAAIMQYLLHLNGHQTSQITFGENLMSEQLLLDIGKLNKMFTFYRGGTRIEQYNNAVINSAYINHVIQQEGESIWIAQRNGRTKDGDDRTQPGLIKMLTVGSSDISSLLEHLNIVPVTISYEIEPCDIQKVRELYIARRESYEKGPDEDFMSILSGITGDKGRIHYVFGEPLNGFIRSLEPQNLHVNDLVERITFEIDRQVHTSYRLWPANYVASDLLRGRDEHYHHYSEYEKQGFEEYMNARITPLREFEQSELRRMFLQMYANPVLNSEKHITK